MTTFTIPDPLLALDLTIRIILSIVLGAAIGLERQWRLRATGIRTNALVSVGAALFVIVGAVGFNGGNADPTRVAAQVVSGIGFLGAGVILRNGTNIRGLATAATLWCAAAVGSLAGAGLGWIAIIGTAGVIAVNTLFRPLSRMINKRTGGFDDSNVATRSYLLDGHGLDTEVSDEREYVLEVVTAEKVEPRIRALVLQTANNPDLSLRSLNVKHRKSAQVAIMAQFAVTGADETGVLERAVQRISLDPKVTETRWWEVGEVDEE